jgi:hypothetical protein
MSNPKIQSASSVAGKETIYVDVDDEITTIIDKVQGAKAKVVALVLPKRAAVLQSIVNMKLLKRTADTADKNLVLVTTEAGLMPLAGAVGLHVASTPTSKPSVPTAPVAPSTEPENVDEPLNIVDGNASDEFDARGAASRSIGELAAAGTASKLAEDDIDDSIDMGDDPSDAPGILGTGVAGATAKVAKIKKDKKLHVPNFDSFRKKLLIGGVLAVVLIGGLIYALTALPKATITVKTDSSTITTNLNLILDTTAKELSKEDKIIPATAQAEPKTATQTVPATGQQNNGQKASGSVSITNCTTDNSEVTLAAGSSITASGHTYILQSGVDLPFSGVHSGKACQSSGTTSTTVNITALKGGADYNLGSSTSFSSSAGSSATITGSATGGTDDITKIVTQTDIATATSKITAADNSAVKQDLVSNLQSKGLLPVATTFLAGSPQVTSSAQAGATADNVTITAVTNYSMLGIQKSDLQSFVTDNVEGQLDKGKQVILDDGIANATFTESVAATATGANVSVQTKSLAGPQLNVAQLKTKLAGKKAGDVKSYIKQTPGVTDVEVKLGPFWVSSVPGKASHVTINIVKADS